MANVSRQAVREAFGALLSANLTTDTVDHVFDYQVADLAQYKRSVVVRSGGIYREPSGFSECWTTKITLDVFLFIRYADPEISWTEENSEDALDALELAVANIVTNQTNQHTGTWNQVSYKDSSEVIVVSIGGVGYRRELIQFEVEVVH